jgi:hypothetical protein
LAKLIDLGEDFISAFDALRDYVARSHANSEAGSESAKKSSTHHLRSTSANSVPGKIGANGQSASHESCEGICLALIEALLKPGCVVPGTHPWRSKTSHASSTAAVRGPLLA